MPPSVSRNSPDMTNTTHCTCAAGSGESLPPPDSTSTMAWENVVANPAMGRDTTHARVPRQCAKRLVTMSRNTPRGMNVYASVTTARSLSNDCWGGRPATGVK